MMATNEDLGRATYWALDGKQTVLARYCQKLLTKQSEDPDLVRIELGRAKIELDLTFSKLMQMSNNNGINLPDIATITKLRESVAALAQVVDANAELEELLKKGDALIKAWPN